MGFRGVARSNPLPANGEPGFKTWATLFQTPPSSWIFWGHCDHPRRWFWRGAGIQVYRNWVPRLTYLHCVFWKTTPSFSSGLLRGSFRVSEMLRALASVSFPGERAACHCSVSGFWVVLHLPLFISVPRSCHSPGTQDVASAGATRQLPTWRVYTSRVLGEGRCSLWGNTPLQKITLCLNLAKETCSRDRKTWFRPPKEAWLFFNTEYLMRCNIHAG